MKKTTSLVPKRIEAELVEFVCTKCKSGFYRVNESREVLITPPAQWPHSCTYCGHEVYIALPYPKVTFKGEDFILAKHVKHLKDPSKP